MRLVLKNLLTVRLLILLLLLVLLLLLQVTNLMYLLLPLFSIHIRILARLFLLLCLGGTLLLLTALQAVVTATHLSLLLTAVLNTVPGLQLVDMLLILLLVVPLTLSAPFQIYTVKIGPQPI